MEQTESKHFFGIPRKSLSLPFEASLGELISILPGFLLRILVAGERCNVTGEYFEKGSTTEYIVVIGYRTIAVKFSAVNGEFSNLRCLRMNTLFYHNKLPANRQSFFPFVEKKKKKNASSQVSITICFICMSKGKTKGLFT